MASNECTERRHGLQGTTMAAGAQKPICDTRHKLQMHVLITSRRRWHCQWVVMAVAPTVACMLSGALGLVHTLAVVW